MSEISLPDYWTKVSLEDVLLKIVGGGTPSKSVPTYYQGHIPWMSVKDMNKNILDDTADHISQEAVENSSTNVIPSGTPIVATRMSLGKVVVANFDSAINQDLKALFPATEMQRDYLIKWYRSVSRYIQDLGTGTTVKGIRLETLKQIEFPLAPLAEQKVIADKLDSMLAQVETTKARLERIPKILKTFRQSVLASAVSGKLTEEWRGHSDGSSIIPLPKSWKIEKASDICEKVQSGSTPRNDPFNQGGKIPFLKVYNIVNQQIDFDYKPQFISKEIHSTKLKRSIGVPNDVLMNIVGPPLGKVAILTDQYPEWNLNQAITLFRPKKEVLDFKYLYFVLCEGNLVRSVMPETKGSVGQVNISLTQCRESHIPLPPIEEQTEIVRRVEELFAFANSVEEKANAALERVNKLTQSILAKAFRGELTADWRAEHPDLISGGNSAEALLERIKAERAALSQSKTKKKSARKN